MPPEASGLSGLGFCLFRCGFFKKTFLYLTDKHIVMKNLYTLIVILFVGLLANAQIVNIPDANFKARLLAASPNNSIASTQTPNVHGQALTFNRIDTNLDGEIQESEAITIKYLNLVNCLITNSTGIESFTGLQVLNCQSNQLTSLNVSGSINLRLLACYENQLTSLNISGLTNLQSITCHTNQVQSLNLSGLTNLKVLNCWRNQLTSLNLSGLTNLEDLSCSNNPIPSLNVNGLMNLKKLSCGSSLLTSIDVSGLTNLTSFYCSYNQLSSLNISGLTNLQDLWCENNQLTNINLIGLTNLRFLDCKRNQLSSIDVSGLTNLTSLICTNNQLSTLDLSGLTSLQSFLCSNNLPLVSLFLKNGRNENGTFLNNPNLQYICADEGQLTTIQNQINQYGYTNCHVNSYCSFTPGGTFNTIQGNNLYDSDNNGCDINDNPYSNMNYSITDGTTSGTFISNNSGSYSIPVQAGTHVVTAVLENPSYFTISPTTASVTFPSATNSFTQDFCITANGIHHDLEVAVFPIGISARPGFDATYKIIYKNKGTQSQSGSLNLAFDDSVLDVVIATPATTSQATNSLTWSFTNLLPFETREINLTFNVNSPMETPAVNGGDLLNYTASITGLTDETPLDNVAALNQTVVNSYDPNDKTCLEGNSITPSMVGKFVHYLIRFENTGTFAAQNVVIRDIIDTNKFDISSLIPLNASHAFTTKISNGNKVEFIFENINLPFDDANNDGYVVFKIKTKPTLVLGDTFSNTAGIYFDYNFPIITNTASTTVQVLSNPDFDFSTVFSLSPVPTKNSLTITTKQVITMSSISIYNTLGQLIQVHTNPTETLDVSGLQTGSYFLKIITDKGTASGKFIKE
jgi:uncharacterized repeat protein (TIGR01451 family)